MATLAVNGATLFYVDTGGGSIRSGLRRPERNASLWTGMDAGIIASVSAVTKVTVQLPADLLKKARRSTGQGVTATVRRGLELVAAHHAYEELRRLRGRVRLSVDWRRLREDRR